MKKFVLFIKGIKHALKDSWFAVLILLFTCCIGIIGAGFCYRTALFYVRQPEMISYPQNELKITYTAKGDALRIGEQIDFDGYFGMCLQTTFNINGEEKDLSIFSLDMYEEGKIDFNSAKSQIVLSDDIAIDVGQKITIAGNDLVVVGKTQGMSYASVAGFTNKAGEIMLFFDKQLSKGDISQLENIIGAKFYRDNNWQGTLGTQEKLFIVLGVVIITMICINVFRLLFIYKQKNAKRYRLYAMLGYSKSRLNFTFFGELFLIILLCMPLPLLIDVFALRPLTTFVGITFMYDILDVLAISACVLIPFALVVILQIVCQNVVTANGNLKKRGAKNER